MVSPKTFSNILIEKQIDFFTGVPDSTLKNFCAYISDQHNTLKHMICANEGGAVSVGVGYHLSSGKIPLVYMQNSGFGNALNPLLSIVDKDVYSIPLLLMIGWRGKPGKKDEPQHITQGRLTLSLLDEVGIPYQIFSPHDTLIRKKIDIAERYLKKNSSPFAMIIERSFFSPYELLPPKPYKDLSISREEAIEFIISCIGKTDIVVATTGMTSRELYEIRDKRGQTHEKDFLTVGGMGHASQIALGIARSEGDRDVFCLDGDGAMIMHMGAIVINGTSACPNFKHIVLNNGAHDSVGGQPTAGFQIDMPQIAKACGYVNVYSATQRHQIKDAIKDMRENTGPSFLEIKVKKGNRPDLGRPSRSPVQNKNDFMEFLCPKKNI